MTCRCHPANRCGKCDELPADIKQALIDFEESEQSPLPNARRDDDSWTERVRRLAEINR
jgi:hypothetical protein